MPQSNPEELVTSVRQIISILSILVALVSIGLAIPLIQGKIPMNEIYGVKIPKSFTSEENWYKINTYGAKVVIILHGIPLILFGIIGFFIPFRSVGQILISFLLVNSMLGICVYMIFQFGKKLP